MRLIVFRTARVHHFVHTALVKGAFKQYGLRPLNISGEGRPEAIGKEMRRSYDIRPQSFLDISKIILSSFSLDLLKNICLRFP